MLLQKLPPGASQHNTEAAHHTLATSNCDCVLTASPTCATLADSPSRSRDPGGAHGCFMDTYGSKPPQFHAPKKRGTDLSDYAECGLLSCCCVEEWLISQSYDVSALHGAEREHLRASSALQWQIISVTLCNSE
ncbi:hypothetical protein ETH_00006920 [Eimeria tenella]|uniref:Uncharacterized protein n=1 Tax=Eimeria tenella TaxID=5802 RepID=U6L1Z2_EIMTE|nr:hypothetical protein ETH_00006920 [Eimeria tenella]CDJ42614.1 hypothetical protein ETH_00006920 [Eimeria tenella]|eukprot:XP_013233364.1 hypothetical protein ETH_00006920 [Eimeria tenella]